MITQEQLKELFDYDSKSGNLIWKISITSAKKGDIAGHLRSPNGYRVVKVKGKNYLVHRLVWMYHHGEMPEFEIDHISRSKLDNRIENLRDANRSDNELNKDVKANNTSGLRGIFFHNKYGMWFGAIQRNGVRISTKMHVNKVDAVKEYISKFIEFMNPDSILLSVIEPHKQWIKENSDV